MANVALLWINGTFGVRSAWSTKVCVHSDSTNHPAWNNAMKITCCELSNVWKLPPTTAGQITKYINK